MKSHLVIFKGATWIQIKAKGYMNPTNANPTYRFVNEADAVIALFAQSDVAAIMLAENVEKSKL